MTAKPSVDPAAFLHEHLSRASPDLLRELMQGFVSTLLSADADSVWRLLRQPKRRPVERTQRLSTP